MMKKIFVVMGVIGLLCVSVSPLYAGGIINKSNLSADYFRSLTRHASTDAADIIPFNPAGVMKMENGMYVKADALYINKVYQNDVPGFDEFESDEPSLVPGFFSVFKQDKWAGFFALTIPGGGGEVIYDNGNARTVALGGGIIAQANGSLAQLGLPAIYTGINDMELEATSVDAGITLGGAFEINEMFSVAAGLRYISATQEFKGSVSLDKLAGHPAFADPRFPETMRVDLERTATGWGYFLGLNVAPTDKLNLGFLYQSNTELDYESDVSEGNSIAEAAGWADGTKEREDLPGILGLGVSYLVTPKFRTELNYTRYLESAAEWEGLRFEDTDQGDSWEVGLSFTYAFTPQWRASFGYLYTDIEGMEPESLMPEAAELDAQTIGLGVVHSPTDSLDITFGYTNVNYNSVATVVDSSRAPAGSELEKHVTAFSLGVQYRF